MKLRSVLRAPVQGKRVLVRTDFDVPIQNGRIVDDARIVHAIPTLKYLLKKKASRIIIISHAGRPHGRPVSSFSLAPMARHLSTLLHHDVMFVKDCLTPTPPQSRIVLLENLRFYPQEETNEFHFSKQLARHADLFVNDAFAVMHRKHASMAGIPHHIPSYAGLHVSDEVKKLTLYLSKPKHPFLAIIGGGKPDKITLLNHLLKKANIIFAGGVLGNLLLNAQGKKLGAHTFDRKELRMAKRLCNHPRLILPNDAICAQAPDKPHTIRIVPIEDVPKTHLVLDAGPATLTHLYELISQSKTILFAGTPGMYENPHFATGTNLIVKWMARSKATTIIAGGDTGASVRQLGLEATMTHVSTGGGASLAFIQGKKLPGLEPLKAH